MTELPPESDEWDFDPDWSSHLNGKWQSNWELTKAHLIAECRLTDEEIDGYGRLMGKMIAQYNGARATYEMPDITFAKDGQFRKIDGWKSEGMMDVIGRTNWQIAILAKSDTPIIRSSISIITFTDCDT